MNFFVKILLHFEWGPTFHLGKVWSDGSCVMCVNYSDAALFRKKKKYTSFFFFGSTGCLSQFTYTTTSFLFLVLLNANHPRRELERNSFLQLNSRITYLLTIKNSMCTHVRKMYGRCIFDRLCFRQSEF